MDSCSCAPMDFFFWLFLETRMMCTHVHFTLEKTTNGIFAL